MLLNNQGRATAAWGSSAGATAPAAASEVEYLNVRLSLREPPAGERRPRPGRGARGDGEGALRGMPAGQGAGGGGFRPSPRAWRPDFPGAARDCANTRHNCSTCLAPESYSCPVLQSWRTLKAVLGAGEVERSRHVLQTPRPITGSLEGNRGSETALQPGTSPEQLEFHHLHWLCL